MFHVVLELSNSQSSHLYTAQERTFSRPQHLIPTRDWQPLFTTHHTQNPLTVKLQSPSLRETSKKMVHSDNISHLLLPNRAVCIAWWVNSWPWTWGQRNWCKQSTKWPPPLLHEEQVWIWFTSEFQNILIQNPLSQDLKAHFVLFLAVKTKQGPQLNKGLGVTQSC